MFVLYIALLTLIFIIFIFDRYQTKHLRIINDLFPGPLSLPILGNILQIWLHRHESVKYGLRLTLFYRRSFRIWVGPYPLIFVITPEDAQKILSSTENTRKGFVYDNLIPWLGDGILISYGSKWKTRRRLLTPAFHFQILETFFDTFHKNIEIFCNKLKEKTDLKSFNLSTLVKLYALDNICETSMGVAIDAQIHSDSEYVKATNDMCRIVHTKIMSPWLRIWPIYKLTSTSRKEKKALSIIQSFSRKVVKERLKEFKKENATMQSDATLNIKSKSVLLDTLLCAIDDHGLKLKDFQEEIDAFIFAGHDTISSALSFAMRNLANHPQYQEKAYEEQLKIFGNSHRPATHQDLQSMPYLEMVIKESLRLFPPVPMIARRTTEDIVLDDQSIVPKNAEVSIVIEYLHKSPKDWERPLEFYPNHFLPENCAKRHPYQFIPFSTGSRNCLGKRYAMMELKVTLSQVLRRFKLLPAVPEVRIKRLYHIVLSSSNGIHIAVTERKVVSNDS